MWAGLQNSIPLPPPVAHLASRSTCSKSLTLWSRALHQKGPPAFLTHCAPPPHHGPLSTSTESQISPESRLILSQKSTSCQIFTRPSWTSFLSTLKTPLFIASVGGEEPTRTPNSLSPTSLCGTPFACKHTRQTKNQSRSLDASTQYRPATPGLLDGMTLRFSFTTAQILPFLRTSDCLVSFSGDAYSSQPLTLLPRV